MKSSHALIVAVGLGIGGALLNWAYLHRRAEAFDSEDFVGIAPGVTINPGEPLLRKHLVKVPIPKVQAEMLRGFAVPYSAVQAVNEPASRLLKGGSLLLEQDLETPLEELRLGEDELAWPIPVDTRVLVPSLIGPGDEVWFLGAAPAVASPTAVDAGPFAEDPVEEATAPDAALPPAAPGSSKIIGPFTVLALGNRLGSAELMRAAKIRQVQENVMMVKVTMRGGTLQSPAKELLGLLESTGSRPLGYLWRPRAEKKE